jgi:hypothetical protein
MFVFYRNHPAARMIFLLIKNELLCHHSGVEVYAFKN